MATHGVAGGGPQGWLSLWRGGEGRVPSPKPLPLSILPPPSGCSSPALLHAGLRKMDFPGCANLAATCSRCAGASKVAQLQTQSSWESGCQASLSPSLPSFVAAAAAWAPSHPVTCCQQGSPFSLPLRPHTSPHQPPPAPSRLPQPSAPMARLQRGSQAGAFIPALDTLPAPYPQPRLSIPFPSPLLMGFPNFLLPRAFPRTPDRRTEAWLSGRKEPGGVQIYPLSP